MGRLILPGDAGFPVFGQQPDLSHPSLNGLIGWWPLNDGDTTNAIDLARGNTAIATNSPQSIVSRNGLTRLFNGVNNYLTAQTAVTENTNCLSFWADPITTVVPEGTQKIFIGSEGLLVPTVVFGSVSSFMTNETVSITGGVYPSSYGTTYISDTITAGIHHFVFNWEGSEYAIYIDGVKRTVYHHGSQGKALLASWGRPQFGARTAGPNYANVALRDARFYNRALSAEEIRSLYYGLDNAEIFRDAYETAVWYDDAASTILTVLPAGIATGETFGTPALSFGGISVAPTGIASVEEFGTTTVSLGVIAVAPTSIASEETFGTPVVTNDGVIISAEAIASAEAFGIATILPGGITLLPASIDSVGTVGTPTVSAGVQLSLTQADIDAIAEAVFARFQLTPSDVNVVTVRGHAVPSGISTLL